MPNKMLIDAAHPEETRVVVTRGSKVEEFDFESATRKQLRGNIYLARVTRVEPSLQAAFIEYGGNRHGFLAFNEIHPDYYQIPVADRQLLIDEEERDAHDGRGAEDEEASAAAEAEEHRGETRLEASTGDSGGELIDVHEEDEKVEQLGSDDALEELPERRPRRARQYKIQEVIKRRQILLVQVVKEERGNKGAALTTYLSLAGRYSVLMPNTARGGGISRKITNAPDRKRLKEVAQSLEVPEGMGIILRTAGANRTKTEVKRDFEYLLRLWESVRDLTLKSSAPALVYEEGSLIKRAIRDLYNKDIDEVQIAGEDAYREAKDFMRMLMPSHAKNVQPYRDSQPIFTRFGVESQLDAMFSPQVQLRSGGYIVINQTEALVSIDVNSGRATREHNIEDTALKTNMEASEEVARQLRLRDLAGLIVIDFIDMEEKRNNRSVERKLKDCLKLDRARIQVGRISHFGLLEMSRQRIRTGVLEGSSEICPHCKGAGLVRSVESCALQILRAIEDFLMKSTTHNLVVRTRSAIALYLLNQKRAHLRAIEERFGLTITISADETVNGTAFAIEKTDLATAIVVKPPVIVQIDSIVPDAADDDDGAEEDEETEETEAEATREETTGAEAGTDDENGSGRRRRRRRRRRGGEHDAPGAVADATEDGVEADGEQEEDAEEPVAGTTSGEEEDGEPRRRRRGRRGGRRRRDRGSEETGVELISADALPGDETGNAPNGETDEQAPSVPAEQVLAVLEPELQLPEAEPAAGELEPAAETAEGATEPAAEAPPADAAEASPPARKRRTRRPRAEKAAAEAAPAEEPAIGASPAEGMVAEHAAELVPQPLPPADTEVLDETAAASLRESIAVAGEAPSDKDATQPGKRAEPEPEEEDSNKPRRTGWWQRSFFGS